jgi:hypothetical protein
MGVSWPKLLCDTDMTDPVGLKAIALSYILRPLMGIFRHNMAVHCLRSPGNLEGKEDLGREGCC